MTKKFVSILMVVIIVFAFVVSTYASSQTNIYELDGYTVIFEENTPLDEARKQQIANELVYGDDGIQTYGLMCTLFGHKYESHYVDVINHRFSATNPRCKQETYEVNICTRCDDSTTELAYYTFISCCPEE